LFSNGKIEIFTGTIEKEAEEGDLYLCILSNEDVCFQDWSGRWLEPSSHHLEPRPLCIEQQFG